MGKWAWMALCAVGLFGAFGTVHAALDGVFPADPPNREWARLRRFEANSPVANGYYGEGVALSGNVLAIGSPGGNNGSVAESGLVEIWVRVAGGWAFAQYLTDPVPLSGSEFGHSVDMCGGGHFIVVGAPGQGSSGGGYVFEQTGPETWTYVAALIDGQASSDAWIGYDVAIDCDGTSSTAYAAVGAPLDDVGGTTWSGSIALWQHQINGTWVQTQRLAPHANVVGARCGLSVDLSYSYVAPFFVPAGRLLFGCPHVDYSGVDSAGVAYVYARSGSTFAPEQTLGPPDPDGDGEFGTNVALVGGYAAVAAPWAPYHGVDDAGRLWVFERGGVGPLYWEASELTVDDFYSTSAQYFFGGSLAIGGDSRGIYVHAGRYKSLFVSGGARCAGVVETFAKPTGSSSWVRSDRLASLDTDDGYDILQFGDDLSADGSEVAIGAYRSTVDDLSDPGAAYLFGHERVFGGDFERYTQTE